jgi:nucleoside triphosphate pyrophosphatase
MAADKNYKIIDLYLASKSLRRVSLLQQMNITFEQVDVDVDESIRDFEVAITYTQRLAKEKAIAGWNAATRVLPCPVLGADTCIEFENKIITKPVSKYHAKEILMRLNGTSHWVITALCLCQGSHIESCFSKTKITMAKLLEKEIDCYIDFGEWDDKAGAYAIQGIASSFITSIEGSYTGVVGLPLNEMRQLCQHFNIFLI